MSKRWTTKPAFDVHCTRCPRLTRYIRQIQLQHKDYYCAPVPSFGSERPQLLIVGLAPGKHGANRTGRPFTGDYAGEVLYRALHHFGFANKAEAVSVNDGLRLRHCRITNAVKCVPPDNKPVAKEINNCNRFLTAELNLLPHDAVILAIGQIAHRAVLSALQLKQSLYPFTHNKIWRFPNDIRMLDSYHCSRYNINTKRLTEQDFFGIVGKAKRLLKGKSLSYD